MLVAVQASMYVGLITIYLYSSCKLDSLFKYCRTKFHSSYL